MNRTNTVIFTLLIMVSTSSVVAQSADTIEELKACSKMTDREVRLACFDNLSERVLRGESADKKPTREELTQSGAVSTATATNIQPLPDDLGKLKTTETKNTEYSGMVTSCKEGQLGDWYFFFDNGQVWKEVDGRRLYFKECNFDVTITKGLFGYKMKIDSIDKTIPVKRHQ